MADSNNPSESNKTNTSLAKIRENLSEVKNYAQFDKEGKLEIFKQIKAELDDVMTQIEESEAHKEDNIGLKKLLKQAERLTSLLKSSVEQIILSESVRKKTSADNVNLRVTNLSNQGELEANKKLIDDLNASLDKRVNQLKETLSENLQLKNDLTKFELDMNHKIQQIQRQETEIQNLKNKVKELIEENEELIQNNTRLSKDLSRSQEKLQDERSWNDKQRNIIDRQKEQLERYSEDIKVIKARHNETWIEKEKIQANYDKLEKEEKIKTNKLKIGDVAFLFAEFLNFYLLDEWGRKQRPAYQILDLIKIKKEEEWDKSLRVTWKQFNERVDKLGLSSGNLTELDDLLFDMREIRKEIAHPVKCGKAQIDWATVEDLCKKAEITNSRILIKYIKNAFPENKLEDFFRPKSWEPFSSQEPLKESLLKSTFIGTKETKTMEPRFIIEDDEFYI